MMELLDERQSLTPEQADWMIQACEAVLASENRRGDLSVQMGTEEEIQTLNRMFRNVDRVTDVLTFPAWEGEDPQSVDGYLGDIMICLKRADEQAKEYGHSIERELCFLTVHGVLHLLGYDHMTETEEIQMRTKQTQILERMGLTR